MTTWWPACWPCRPSGPKRSLRAAASVLGLRALVHADEVAAELVACLVERRLP